MYLSSEAIAEEIGSGQLTIRPFSPPQLRPASYVVRLGNRFRRWKAHAEPIRLWALGAADAHLHDPIQATSMLILPGEFILASTSESIGIPNDRFGSISPLSHVARFGLGINLGADFVNPGFGLNNPSPLTLELVNHNPAPLELTAGMPIGHLRIGVISRDNGTSDHAKSIYEGRDPLVGPQLFEEWSSRILVSDVR